MRSAEQRYGRRLVTNRLAPPANRQLFDTRELIIGVVHKAARSIHQHDLCLCTTLDRDIKVTPGLVGEIDTTLTKHEALARVTKKKNAIGQVQHRLRYQHRLIPPIACCNHFKADASATCGGLAHYKNVIQAG